MAKTVTGETSEKKVLAVCDTIANVEVGTENNGVIYGTMR